MSVTVIDKLLIELGLDPTEFKKGTAEADKSLKTTSQGVVKGSRDMGASITAMARKFAVAFLGFKGVQGLLALNHTASQMGYLAANTGQTTENVNALAESMRLAGGEASDMSALLQQISAQQTEATLTGKPGWWEGMQRLRFEIRGAGGAAKDTYAVILDMADALGKLPRPEAFNIAQSQLGLNPNQINFLLQGRKAIEAQKGNALQRFKLDAAQTASARKTEQSLEQLKITGEHAMLRLLNVMRPFIDQFTGWLDKVSQDPTVMKGAVDGLKALGDGIQLFADVVKTVVKGWRELFSSDLGKAFLAQGHTAAESFHKFAKDPSIENFVALAAPSVGGKPLTPEELAASNQPGGHMPTPWDAMKELLFAMKDKGEQWAAENAQRYGIAAANGTAGGVTNNVQIDSIQINTDQKSATGIAKGLNEAIKKKVTLVDQTNSRY